MARSKAEIDAEKKKERLRELRRGPDLERFLEGRKRKFMATLQDAASDCGLSLAGVKKICSKLQEIGALVREGSKRDGRWVVK